MVAAPPPPTPAAIVRAWSTALNANDNAAAAKLFAPNAEVIQPPLAARLTSPGLAKAFNASLPCAGTIVKITVHGDRATATFVLGHRPGHTCTGKGQKAAAVFVVHDGKIVLWEQVPVPASPTTPPA
ncbi:MAG: nuclear transport factor 2 family protein [Actinobacteria bacterium]|nr:nuclear transport factor 2 family protein [Actinomycetota bacterium]MBV8479658.1 nuclear transport factor 2 family protein [Actinomycetota bacterium]